MGRKNKKMTDRQKQTQVQKTEGQMYKREERKTNRPTHAPLTKKLQLEFFCYNFVLLIVVLHKKWTLLHVKRDNLAT